MRKYFFLIVLLLLFSKINYAQNPADTIKIAADSAFYQPDSTTANVDASLDSLIKIMADMLGPADQSSSYMQVSVGVGNRLFSMHNNSLNAQQTVSTTVFTPAIGYFHKTGISLSGGAYLLNDAKKGFGANQYSISPAYELLDNKNIDFDISYTHYFVKDKYSPYSSPIQNDWYASLSYTKQWLQPGIAIGYSSGTYKQTFYKDTTVGLIHKKLYDSMTSNLQAFSLIPMIEHRFDWYALFNKNDGAIFIPSLMLNTGSSKTTLKHKTNAPLLVNRLTKKGKLPKLQTTSFEIQSIGMNLDLNYSIGKFFIEPQCYFDYYLPDTNEKKFTQTFDVSIGFNF